ncbi:hypothetical protein [Alkalispirochaeta alkalica]|uniref:hypothetical protein n=1 Tax=Alkalispirochaeta alkalica TaxID=46356 RepID=UPI0003671382|nr:hypothetical protein [Alkalispirochaeta alkalica]
MGTEHRRFRRPESFPVPEDPSPACFHQGCPVNTSGYGGVTIVAAWSQQKCQNRFRGHVAFLVFQVRHKLRPPDQDRVFDPPAHQGEFRPEGSADVQFPACDLKELFSGSCVAGVLHGLADAAADIVQYVLQFLLLLR